MFFYWLVFALNFGYPRQESPKPEEQAVVRQQASLLYERHRQAAIRMNELAAHINSEADARAFVDAVADMFADNLPPAWATRGIRERIARAEYEAVSNPLRQIHSMRDATFAMGQVMWSRGTIQTAWTMPNIFAVGADGKVAEGCRAVEAIRVIHDLDSLFDNLRSARERLRKGIVASDAVKRSLENTNANQKTTARLEVRIDTNPLRPAEMRLEVRIDSNPLRPAEIRYVREHGAEHFNQFLEMLLEELFPAM